MSLSTPWQAAEDAQPVAQRHADVPDWITAWDVWSRTVLTELQRIEAAEVAARKARNAA